MSAPAITLLTIWGIGWLIAAGVVARRMARTSSGFGNGHLGPLEAFCGLLVGYAWPLYLICLGFARLARIGWRR